MDTADSRSPVRHTDAYAVRIRISFFHVHPCSCLVFLYDNNMNIMYPSYSLLLSISYVGYLPTNIARTNLSPPPHTASNRQDRQATTPAPCDVKL